MASHLFQSQQSISLSSSASTRLFRHENIMYFFFNKNLGVDAGSIIQTIESQQLKQHAFSRFHEATHII